ncbi:MAG: Omp28-related outer membrane protein [Flavobacterium sp.]|nr:Omp28-related outer membrane protein [Flavobacterium sp.]
MKNYYFIGVFFFTLSLLSCGENSLIYSPIKVDDNVDAAPITGLFQKQVLIEDYTGTWCGNCARVAYAIERTKEASDRVVSVAIHHGNDPYDFEGIGPLKNLISPNSELALPQSRLNRITTWTFPEVNNVQQALNLTSNNCGLGLALNSTVADGNINLDVKVKFAQNYSNLKLVVYVLEDKLIYRQTNYSTFYGGVNPIPSFEHNHVLRASLTNLMGDSLTNTNYNQTVTTNFSVPIPSDVANAENINFVAFVIEENNNVINVRAAKKNENQEFQENL